MTLIPCTPSASIVLRSAWMPAPPPESDPATVSTRGGVMIPAYGGGRSARPAVERAGGRPGDGAGRGEGHRDRTARRDGRVRGGVVRDQGAARADHLDVPGRKDLGPGIPQDQRPAV